MSFRMGVLSLGLWLGGTAAVLAINPVARDEAIKDLQARHAGADAYVHGGRVSRVYGTPLAVGNSAAAAADAFRRQQAALFEVAPEDIQPYSVVRGEADEVPLMYDPATNTYKFTLVRFAQQRDDIPVFRADLRVLVRNTADHPVVLASSSLRSLDELQVGNGLQADAADAQFVSARFEEAKLAARSLVPSLNRFTDPNVVIWAGVNDMVETPRLALITTGDDRGNGKAVADAKWLYVVDLETGTVLYEENQLLDVDVTGNVAGVATEGTAADYCNDEVSTPMPHPRVNIGTNEAFGDVNGDFTLSNTGSGIVTVESPVRGEFFVVTNLGGADALLQETVTPPGPADFLHNAANTEFTRGEVNAYIHANLVRDFVLMVNPSYPVIGGQTGFGITVNEGANGFCPGNAQYQGDNLRFCAAGSDRPNTAWSSVVYHEYGHHLVNVGGSGQGQYGEGMSDTVSTIITDESGTGFGFFISSGCSVPLRDAADLVLYPCSGAIHACGRLISGSVWDLRNELIDDFPATYLDILRPLVINSIPLHVGDLITPQIAVDFLTLDDDDGILGNGTPHREQICTAFALHDMDCPPLPTGLQVAPGAAATFEGLGGGPFGPPAVQYTLTNQSPGSIAYNVTADQPWVSINNSSGFLSSFGSIFVAVSINGGADAFADGLYEATLTFTNVTDGDGNMTLPLTLVVGEPLVGREWSLDSDPGWAREGLWAFGRPLGLGSENGDPASGFTGPNVFGFNLAGDYGDDLPPTYLTLGPFDATGYAATKLRFRRWLGVESNNAFDEATVEASSDGNNFTTVWRATETGAAVSDTSWQLVEIDIAAVADGESAVWVRWGMGPTDGNSTYPGWNIDDVEILAIGAEEVPLTIRLPDGVPSIVSPNDPVTLRFQIESRGEQYVPGSGILNYRFDAGAWQTLPLTSVGGDLFEATLPSFDCDAQPEFFVTADGDGGATVINPADAPATYFSIAQVGETTVEFTDDFESDLGWSVSGDAGDGQWERAYPQDNGRGDPPSDLDGSGQCFLTDADMNTTNSDVDDGETILTSPMISLPDGGIVSYHYWLSDISGGPLSPEDVLRVDIATDAAGNDWQTVRTYSTAVNTWRPDTIVVGTETATSTTVRFRFAIGDLGSQNVVEGGLDAFSVELFNCEVVGGQCPGFAAATPAACPECDIVDSGGGAGDGIVTGTDLLQILNTANFGLCTGLDSECQDLPLAEDPCADIDGSGRVTGSDFLVCLNSACFGL